MYARSVQGLSRDDAPAWLALAADDRDGWIELARFAVDAADELRDQDVADDALDVEGHLREELEGRYRQEIDHWRFAVAALERDLNDTRALLREAQA